jgi:hypothetical protein
MSILKIASLVVTPNTYEESKLLAVVPSNGSGDLDFVRASTKTRVNSEGFISDTCKNLLSYSSNLSNAVWEKFTTVVTFNAGTSPDGLNNAVKIARGGATDIFLQTYNPEKVPNHVRSVWAKTVSGTGFTNLLSYNSNVNSLFFITNEWQRFEINSYNVSGNASLYIVDFRASGTTLTEILVWAPQAEVGISATSFFPTTNRLNVPSIDYTGGGCPSILLEPQRTNSFIESQPTNSDYWQNATQVLSNVLSPISNFYYQKINANSTSPNTNRFYKLAIPTNPGSLYSFSFFAQYYNCQYLHIRCQTSGGVTGTGICVDLINKTFSQARSDNNVLVASCVSFSFINSRINLIFNSESNVGVLLYFSNSSTEIGVISPATEPLSVYATGFQIEQGSYPTSYIPTQASAVTRLQDSINSLNNLNLLNSREGVFHATIASLGNEFTNRAICISDGSNLNRVIIAYTNTSNTIQGFFSSQYGSISLVFNKPNITDFTNVSVRYKNNDFSLWVDGVKVSENLFIKVAADNTLSRFDFKNASGTSDFFGKVKNLQVYKTALSDDEMQLLGSTSYNTYQEMATALNYVTQ